MLKNMIAFLALTCLCGVALGLSPDYIYWKCENSGYLWQTDKTGQNPVQVRAAAWMGGFDSPLAAMTPDGAIIVEMIGQIWYAGIRKHDAASGSYVDMRLWGYDPEAGGSVGCDNNYIYFCCDYPGNVIDKFRISDGYHVSGTTIDRYSNYCFNLAVMNDTVWVGDGSGYLYAYPVSWMDGGNHSAARSQYIGDMSGTPLGMTWDGTYYYIAGSPSYRRWRSRGHNWSRLSHRRWFLLRTYRLTSVSAGIWNGNRQRVRISTMSTSERRTRPQTRSRPTSPVQPVPIR
jgi:hypothetical protein